MTQKFTSLLTILILSTACVTVNVYFPESAAERAADIFIRDVYGQDAERQAPAEPGEQPQSQRLINPVSNAFAWLGNLLVPAAHAQAPDINIQTPAINALKSSMSARHQKLQAGYNGGGVGMAANGLIVVRDPKAIDLKQRNQIKQLVAQENRDRNRLYAEVAKSNGHPEWENDIRAIFAQRWVGNAPGGWWYESAGTWQKK